MNSQTSASISTDAPVNQPPVAVAAVDTDAGFAPLLVSFDGSASSDPEGGALSYSWDFGDGQTAVGPQAGHSYASAGSYTAVLTVRDADGAEDTDSVVITVLSGQEILVHVADISLAVVEAKGGMQVQGTVTIVDETGSPVSGAAVSADWSGPKSSSDQQVTNSAGQAVFMSQKARGSFTYTLTVTDVTVAGGLYDSAGNTVTSDSISN